MTLLHFTRRFRLLLGGVFIVIALLTKTTPESAHEFSRLGTVESLVERGTFQLDDSSFIRTIDKIRRDGRFYSHQPPLLALLETPVYAALRVTGMRFNNRGRLVMTYLFSLLTSGLALLLTMVVLSRALVLLGIDARQAETYGVVLPLGTWLLPYGLVANNHVVAGLLLATAIWLLLRIEHGERTGAMFVATGATLGMLTAVEILPIVSFVPVTLAYLALRGDVTGGLWLRLFAGLVVPLAVHAVANIRITGDMIPAGFHHELFVYDGSSFDQQTLTGTIKHASIGAAADYAWASLIASKGFFTFAPILAVGLICGMTESRWWARARGIRHVLLVGILLSLGAAILTTNNFGGEAVGFRHAAYLSPAMIVLLAPWLADAGRAKRSIVTIGATVSMISMLIFASPRPWSRLTVDAAAVRPARDYTPIVVHVINGDLLKP